MIYGTPYFVSFEAALDYYSAYGGTPETVRHQIAHAAIYIGKPPLKPTERLVMLDNGKRYGIADDGPLTSRQRCDIPA